MKRLVSVDVFAGSLFCLFGAATVWFALRLGFGTAGRLGPGAFPTLLGYGLILTGLAVALRGFLRAGAAIERIAWRPLVAILGGLIVFGLMVPRLGLVIATILAAVIARLGQRPVKAVETAILAVSLAVFVAAVFVWALGVSIPVWPTGWP